MNKPTNVTPEKLFEAIASLGPLYAAQLGYFNALTDSEGAPTNVTVLVDVVAPTDTLFGLPPTYGYGLLDLTPYNLTEIPVLSGTVIDPIEGVSYPVDFQDVSTASARVHCVYGQIAEGVDRNSLPPSITSCTCESQLIITSS